MKDNAHAGHRERLRNRFCKEGLEHFEAHNILELLLFYAFAQKDTNEIAHRLLDHFGSLSAVFDASVEDLAAIEGMGKRSAVLIKLIPELFRAYEEDKNKERSVLDTAEKAFRFFLPKYIGRTDEFVLVACLDSACKVLCCEIVNQGTVSAAEVNVRKIAELAIRHHASGVILSHNHPNGMALASDEDIMTTDAVNYALKLIGIRLIDHIIVAGEHFVSFADIGGIK